MRVLFGMLLAAAVAGCQVTIGDGQGGAGAAGSPGGQNNQGQGAGNGVSGDDTGRRGAIDELVTQAGKLEVASAQSAQEIPCNGQCPADGPEGNLYCSYKRYDETKVFENLVAFAPNSATLWPGAVVIGQDAKEGLLTPVGVGLAPVTFSVSLENLSGPPTGKMSAPSLSSFREEMQGILKGADKAKAPARLEYREERVHSEEHFGLQLGFGVGFKSFGAESAFNFSSGSSRTRLIVRFTQTYYTIDVDTPKTPADFFSPDVTAAQLSAFVSGENPPLYVQSISYGRQGFFFLETDASFEEIQTSLNVSFDAIFAKAEASVSTTHKNRIESSTMKVVILGGSGTSAVQSISGYEGFLQAIQDGAEYSPESPGVPIAYKLAYLDNAAASFHLTSEYSVRNCTKTKATLSASLTNIKSLSSDGFGSSDYFGEIGVAYPTTGSGGCDDSTAGYLPLMSYGPGQWWSPGSDYSNAVDNVSVGPGKQLCIYVDLTEEDTFVNDQFKTVYKDVPLASGSYKIPVSGSEEEAEVWVNIDVK